MQQIRHPTAPFSPRLPRLWNISVILLMKGVRQMNKEELEVGSVYEVDGRHFNVGVWTGEDFRGPAVEFKHIVFRHERHYDDGLPDGTCKPLRKLNDIQLKPPYDGMNLLKLMKILDDELLERRNDG